MLIKLQLLGLAFLSGQLVASSAVRAAERIPVPLVVNTAAVIDPKQERDQYYITKLRDPYVCHKFRKNFKDAIEKERLAAIERGEGEKALSNAVKKIFGQQFKVMYFCGTQTLNSGSVDEWSMFLKRHNPSISCKPVPGTFNLLRHDPFLVVRK